MEKNQRLLVNMMHLVVVFVMVFFVSSCNSEKQENAISVALFQAPASEALIKLIPEFEKLSGVKWTPSQGQFFPKLRCASFLSFNRIIHAAIWATSSPQYTSAGVFLLND